MPLTADRDTPRTDDTFLVLPVAANTKIHAGALVALDAAGNAVPAAVVATHRAAGRAEGTIDNTGGLAGALTVTVRRGVFKFANSGVLPLAQADVLGTAYIADDQTVRALDGVGGVNPVAGKVIAVDADGVWVEVR